MTTTAKITGEMTQMITAIKNGNLVSQGNAREWL